MSQDRNRKPLTKDRLVGMHVVDGEGNDVGTAKDIAFKVAKVGMSMIVETKSGETKEIPFASIQAAGDYLILKPHAFQTQAVQTQTTVSQTMTQQPQQAQSQICPTCGGPLTYIPQYQRWYCYRDQAYASGSNPGSAYVSGSNLGSATIAQFLSPNEQLLFYSEAAEIKEHHGKAGQAALGLGKGARAQRGLSTKAYEPKIRVGEIAITDRRIYLVNRTSGFFSEPQPLRNFDAIYDPEYAKQGIELAKAKNAEITQQAKGVGMFSKSKFMHEQGYKRIVNVIIGASLEKAVLGGEYVSARALY